MDFQGAVTMNILSVLSLSGELNLNVLALGLGATACAFVILGVWMTRQYLQKTVIDVDVERDYIADDQVSWTELMRILD